MFLPNLIVPSIPALFTFYCYNWLLNFIIFMTLLIYRDQFVKLLYLCNVLYTYIKFNSFFTNNNWHISRNLLNIKFIKYCYRRNVKEDDCPFIIYCELFCNFYTELYIMYITWKIISIWILHIYMRTYFILIYLQTSLMLQKFSIKYKIQAQNIKCFLSAHNF